jgi:aerobic carbon-monoxide dehydrogenase medium subunit
LKSAPFDYERPSTLHDAVGLLEEHGDEAKVLAGGQSLVPMLALRLTRFERLIDLNAIAELRTITRDDDTVRVGAMVRQAVAEHNADIAAAVPLVARALPHIGHFQIRNRGTIGGSTTHADPASELPAVALALDAELEVAGPTGVRFVPAREFFLSMWTTAVAENEILIAIHYPIWRGRTGFAVREFARRHGDFALAGAVSGVAVNDDGVVTRVAIGLFGMGSTPLRALNAEAAVLGRAAAAVDLDEVAHVATSTTEPLDDIHATGAYRRTLATALVKQALRTAISEALSG